MSNWIVGTLDLNDHSVHSRPIDKVKINRIGAPSFHSATNSNSADNFELQVESPSFNFNDNDNILFSKNCVTRGRPVSNDS
ncbi:hypothetical protein Smp_158940 [Schistosoma mansoni]|uniref:Uncharacterized protein n=1 Tax=Schistosoma mansoni TaxID=6183 RepID=G4VHW0_SCHMA|nr:hypothetical protein Smp_158940 [Schistosoma mansoni]|eukprot:XP_018651619.1 hypothetical protein Smp_158940 [Schistosoma mansoni]